MNHNIDQSLQLEIDNMLESYKKNQNETTIELALSIIKKNPKYTLSWKILGSVYSQTGQTDKALSIMQNVEKLNPKDPEVHNNLGVILFKLKRLIEAEKYYNKAIELKPDYAEAYNNLGNTCKEFGRLTEAENNYKKAVKFKKNYVSAHYQLGLLLHQLGKLEEAEKSYNSAIEYKTNYAEAYSNLGNIHKEFGRLTEAEKSFFKAIELKPDYAEAYFNMGKLFKKLGKINDAIKYFEKTLKLNPQDQLGANLELAILGKKQIPKKTPLDYMQNFYKFKSKTWDNFETNKYYGRKLIEVAFKKNHSKEKRIDILDLGCGTGGLANFLNSYSKTLTGVDSSKDILNLAEKINFYDSLYNKEIESYLSEISIQYDSIVASAVMIHFFDLDSIFSLINDSLKINGKFIFSVFESTVKDKVLNSFLMYSHSDNYITSLADRLKFKIIYRQTGIHEYHKGTPINAIIYVFQKS